MVPVLCDLYLQYYSQVPNISVYNKLIFDE